ncbi:hypothetical protein [Streptomyces fradiae]|uniref:hypothetical protein n=1 Tax=Streptomyces fradiae TaxID=1906 RepID=UPI00367CB091
MAARSLENDGAGIRAARTVEILGAERGIAQRELAAWLPALGHPLPNRTLSRIERVSAAATSTTSL